MPSALAVYLIAYLLAEADRIGSLASVLVYDPGGHALFVPAHGCVVSVEDSPSAPEYQTRLDWCATFLP